MPPEAEPGKTEPKSTRNINLRGLDISLFTVFDAVMTERNVTRAARRLNMSQPAVSSAIKKLRYLLDDQLFRRIPGGVRPTQRAQELATPVQYFLTQMRTLLEPSSFSPETEFRRFRFAMSEHCSTLILPPLSRTLQELAPNIQVVVQPKNGADVPAQLESGEIDMAIGSFRECPPRMKQVELFMDRYVCVTRKGHPLSGKMGAEEFIQAHHLRISPLGTTVQEIDMALRYKGMGRHVAMTINQLVLAPSILKHTDLVLTANKSLAEFSDLFEGLAIHALPLELTPFSIQMIWHGTEDKNPAAAWLRGQIRAIAANFNIAA